jgi:AcrR family transcriptional regulator
MGISDRREREKTELRTQILAAARQLFIEQGIEKTSIRNIADMIEYSPGIIYHYFKDKNDILHELHKEGFDELKKRMGVLLSVSNPMERLKALGRTYVQFAEEQPDMYDLMFIKEAPMDFLQEKEAMWKEGATAFDLLRHTVLQCMEAGHFKGHDVERLSYMFWAQVHGIVSLSIRKRHHVVDHCCVDSIVRSSYESFVMVLDVL